MARARSHPPFPPGFRLVPPGGSVLPAVAGPGATVATATSRKPEATASGSAPAAALHSRSRPRPQRLWLAVHLPGFAGEVGLAGVPAGRPAVLVTPAARSLR